MIGTTRNVIRTAFTSAKTDPETGAILSSKLRIYIGREIAEKFNWKPGDRIGIEISKSDPRIIRLFKTLQSDMASYKLAYQPGQVFYSIVFTWSKFVPKREECYLKITEYTSNEGGIVIYMHGTTYSFK